MSLPATVGGSWSEHLNVNAGVFEYDSTLWVVLAGLEIRKSTDGGQTWTVSNSAASNYRFVSGTLHGNILAMGVAWESSTGDVFIGTYGWNLDTEANEWSSVSNTNPVAQVNLSGTYPAHIAVRSNNDVVILHQSTAEMIMGTDYRRIAYSVYDGILWSTTVPSFQSGLETNYDTRTAILGTSDRVHFFYTEGTGGPRLATLNSSNSISTTSHSAGINSDNYSHGIADIETGEVSFIYRGGGPTVGVRSFTSADSPTIGSEQTASAATPETTNANPGAVAYDSDGTLHALYIRDDNQNIEHTNDQGTGTWTTPEAFATATAQGIAIGAITNAIGVLYNDNGTVKYDNVSLSQSTQLTPQDISHSVTVDNTSITQDHVLAADDITFSVSVDETTIEQNHIIVGQDISTSVTLDNTTLTQDHILSPQDASHSVTLDNTTIEENYNLDVQDISHSVSLDNGSLTQNHILSPDDISFAVSADETTITQNHVLEPQDASHSVTLDTATIEETNALTPQDITHSLSLDEATVSQVHDLLADDIAVSPTLDNTSLEQNHILPPDDILFNVTTDETTIEQDHDLFADDISFSVTLDNATIDQTNNLTPQDISHSLALDEASITQDHVLAPDDILFNVTTDEATIEQDHKLATQDITHSLSLDNTTLDLNFTLEPQDIGHAVTLDSTTLAVSGDSHVLETNDIAIGQSLPSIMYDIDGGIYKRLNNNRLVKL